MYKLTTRKKIGGALEVILCDNKELVVGGRETIESGPENRDLQEKNDAVRDCAKSKDG